MLPLAPFFDELEKLGAVSADEARRSFDQLQALDQSKPTLGQVARYGLLGAAAAPAVHAIGNLVEGKPPIEGMRELAGQAVKGAIGMGAVPLLRQHLDRRAAYGRLKKFMTQEHVGDYGAAPGAMNDSPMTAGLSR